MRISELMARSAFWRGQSREAAAKRPVKQAPCASESGTRQQGVARDAHSSLCILTRITVEFLVTYCAFAGIIRRGLHKDRRSPWGNSNALAATRGGAVAGVRHSKVGWGAHQ